MKRGGYTCPELQIRTIRGTATGPPFASWQQQQEFASEVAGQVEGLLFVAHKVQLQRLLETVHMFVFGCHATTNGLLGGCLHYEFSERVVTAAVGSNSSITSQRAYLASVLTRPCGMQCTLGIGHLIKLVGSASFDAPTQQLRFKAKMQQDFLGYSEGKSGCSAVAVSQSGM